MRIALLAVAIATAMLPAAAQEKPPELPKPPRAQKIVQLKYASPEAMQELLQVFGCCARSNRTFKTMSLDYPVDIMPAVEDAVRRFDIPAAAPKNVELTAYFLIASDKEAASGTPAPPELDPVLKQLRSVFAYKSLVVFDSLFLRMGSGQGGTILGTPADSLPPSTTTLRVRRWAVVAGDKGDIVSIENLTATAKLPNQTGSKMPSSSDVNLERIDVPVGQKVVVGRSNLEGPGKALIVVLSAKVL